ncbi:hypothetical protein IFO70_21600 [Phormidium tenue FACHB-886]|nr:hypothetical protein [Phormidium tenue FACHB-886]
MFTPTHVLVSRSRKTPVQLVPSANGFKVLTEPEWQRGSEPAFEMRPRQGFFCQGVSVVGFKLEPIAVDALSLSEQSASSAQ